MKKIKFLFLLIATIIGYTSMAQVAINKDGSVPNSSSILHVKGDATNKNIIIEPGTNGNVGIGETNPSEKLVVDGNIDINSYLYFDKDNHSTKIFRSAYSLYLDAPNGDIRLDNGTLNVDCSTDRVGIGISNPNSKLEVAGLVHSTTGGFKFPDGSTQTTAAEGLWVDDSYGIHYNDNVGINTTSASTDKSLYINGGSNFVALEAYNSTSRAIAGETSTGRAIFGLANNTSGYAGYFTGKVSFSDRLERQSDNNTYIDFTNNDEVTISAGGINMIKMDEASSNSNIIFDVGSLMDIKISQYNPTHIKMVPTYTSSTGIGYIGTSSEYWNSGYIYNIYTYNFTNYSDKRLKKNIHTIKDALEKTSQLRGVSFEWKNDNADTGQKMGVIAQEVEKIFPDLVTEDEKGYKSVSYTQLVGVLIEAIKELKKDNENLEKRLDILESK